MAGIFDRFLDSMKLNDDDYDEDDEELFDDEDEDEDYDDEPRTPKKTKRPFKPSPSPVKSAPEPEEDPAPASVSRPHPQSAPAHTAPRSNVVPVRSSGRGMEVCMIKPTSFDDSREICDTLLSGRAVVINLEGLHIEIAQRIIDFTSGACYSMGGNLQMISKFIFIVTPRTVELSGDFQDMVALSEDPGLSSVSFNL